MKKKRTILLFDDSQSLAILTKKTLEQAGFNVCTAKGCSDIRGLLESVIPDAILLGKELPDGDGIAFCRELREYNIPVLLLSGDENDELPALQAGASDFMKKPYDCNILIERIGTVMDKDTGVFQRAEDQDEEQIEIKPKIIKPLTEQQPFLSEAASQSKTSGKTTTDKNLTIKLAACFLLVVMGVGILGLLSNSLENATIADELPPLAAFSFVDDDDLPDSESELESLISAVSNVTILTETAELDIHIFNPADNPYYVIFEIELADGESLYVSGLVKPGEHNDRIKLSREFEKGEYDAFLIMCCYTEDGIAEGNVIRTAIHITAD